MSEAEPLLSVLRRIQRRLRFWAALEGAVAGGGVGLIALAGALALSRWRGDPGPAAGRAAALVLTTLVAGVLWRALRPIPLERCARAVDRALDGEDRALSALSLLPSLATATPSKCTRY